MRRLLVLVLGLALLAGCGGDDGDDGTPPVDPDFEDVPWVVSAGLGAPSWEQFAPSARFSKGKVSGSAGCNTFTAHYEVDGRELELRDIATSLMTCPPLADPVEAEYLDALRAVAGWRLERGEFVLTDEDGHELLRFREPSLTGSWAVTALRRKVSVESLIEGTGISAIFGEDGILAGSAGCNEYEAAYTVDQTRLRIRRPTSGRQRCDTPEGVMGQERRYLRALPRTRSYEISGSRLTLLDANGEIIATLSRP